MSTNTETANTPYYVLVDGSRFPGPMVAPSKMGSDCSMIYGFSNKAHYDVFLANVGSGLKPFPLVKFYLAEQVARNDGLKLVVLNAVGPKDPILFAATMETVLEAQKNLARHVTVAYQLQIDKETGAYSVDEVAS